MERIFAEDLVEVEQRYVSRGDRVSPGTKIMSVRNSTGVVEEVLAIIHGHIEFIVGDMIKPRKFNHLNEKRQKQESDISKLIRINPGLATVFERGDILCQYTTRFSHSNAKSRTLTPTNSRRISVHRAAGINLN
jgi:hypothetical protein